MKETINFKLNDKPTRWTVDGERMLLWALRSEPSLTGTKYGCGEGFCGTCTVLVNKEAIRSCQFPVKNVKGKEVITIEGLAKNGNLHPLQKAFIKHNALQCGFCTPGMILNAYSVILKNPRPIYKEILQSMDENLCRCGSHARIVEAIKTAAKEMKGGNKR